MPLDVTAPATTGTTEPDLEPTQARCSRDFPAIPRQGRDTVNIRASYDFHIEERPANSLTLRRNNPRTHSQKQIRQIATSIETFGFTNPVLVDASGTVIAGHGRVRAAKLLGLQRVPTIRLDHLSPEQIRTYVIADNRLAENAGWDRELLALEFQGLAELDLDFDLTVTGFETPEIDLLVGDVEVSDAVEDVPKIDPDRPVVSRAGDLWVIGRHRLLCGDSTEAGSYDRLFGDSKARMVFIDPPYNVPIDGHVSGLGRVKHMEFAMASGEMSKTEFTDFLEKTLSHHAGHSLDGAIHFVCMDWRHMGELLVAGLQVYSELKNVCVWAKTNAGMGSLYRSQHEFIFVFKNGSAPHINNVALGRHGRYRTNVWHYRGVNTFGPERQDALAMHPTVKPVRMVADAILDCSRRGEIVLDGFAGSGTTLLAAEITSRVGYGIEIDPRYVDATLRRLAEHAGLEATHAEVGLTFTEVEAKRRAD